VFCGLLLILNSFWLYFILIKVKIKSTYHKKIKNNKTCVIATTSQLANEKKLKNITIKENNYNKSVAKL
jgi:hypothetical protein